MKTHITMKRAERDLAGRIAQAAFANPFSEQRYLLDRQIADATAHDGGDTVQARLLARVGDMVADWRRRGAGNPSVWSRAEDRQAALLTILFDLFHRSMDDFDRHIRAQIAAGPEPIALPFAPDMLAAMRAHGFGLDEARHYFAIFFQLRRAFHFIEQSLAGRCRVMRHLRRQLWDNVFTHDMQRYAATLWNRLEDFSTLLLGETGTGKGAAALAIGRSGYIPFDLNSGRFKENFQQAFVSINLSQYPEALIESELFGHRKGAFTGAVDHHTGLFARCSPCGAVFLDEIGDLNAPVQTKLLRVLQERVFSPVGGHEPQRFSGRVIAATHRDLADLRRKGLFREDFYYRLCSDEIRVPTLRERLREDAGELDILLAHILQRMAGDDGAALTGEVASLLRRDPGADYAWPGNVRELEQAARRVLLRGEHTIPAPPPAAHGAEGWLAEAADGHLSADALLNAYCQMLHVRGNTYQEIARLTRLDWRTVKKRVLAETNR